MKTPVICNNCGIKWVRIVPADSTSANIPPADIQYNCPKCGSNDYRLQEASK